MRAWTWRLVALSLCASCATGGVEEDAGGQGIDAGARDAAWGDGSPGDAAPRGDAATGDAAPLPIDAGPPPVDAPAIVVRCGDGIIDPPEVCDDGNNLSGDRCSADCRSVECTGSSHYEDPATHHCYWRETSVGSREAGISSCASRGGYLIRWSSTAERSAAYGPTLGGPGGRVWIGLTRVGSTWTWDDGTPSATFASDFRSGEPSGDGTCVEWGPGDSLNDISCGSRRDSVCEREPAGTRR